MTFCMPECRISTNQPFAAWSDDQVKDFLPMRLVAYASGWEVVGFGIGCRGRGKGLAGLVYIFGGPGLGLKVSGFERSIILSVVGGVA